MPILKSWGTALGTVIHSFIGSPLRTRSPAKRRLLDWRRLRRGIAGELPPPAPVGLEQHCIRIAREAPGLSPRSLIDRVLRLMPPIMFQ